MRTSRLRGAVVVLLVCGAGAGLAGRLGAAEPKPPAYDETALKKAVVQEASATYQMAAKLYQDRLGGVTPEDVYRWSRRLLEAQLDLAGEKDERIAAFRDHLKRMADLEERIAGMAKAGLGCPTDASVGKYYRTQAELWLARGEVR